MQTLYAVGSVSNAMRGKRLLEKHGIRAYIRKINADHEQGCGYGLLVQRSSNDVVSVLRAGGVTVREVQERDGL